MAPHQRQRLFKNFLSVEILPTIACMTGYMYMYTWIYGYMDICMTGYMYDWIYVLDIDRREIDRLFVLERNS